MALQEERYVRTWIRESVHMCLSSSMERTFEMWTPSDLWTPMEEVEGKAERNRM